MNIQNNSNVKEVLNNVNCDNFDVNELSDIKGDTLEEKIQTLENEITHTEETNIDSLDVNEIISNIKCTPTENTNVKTI